eukprot:scaffold234676_cov15-Tisochrysis_lutea.AAC.1
MAHASAKRSMQQVGLSTQTSIWLDQTVGDHCILDVPRVANGVRAHCSMLFPLGAMRRLLEDNPRQASKLAQFQGSDAVGPLTLAGRGIQQQGVHVRRTAPGRPICEPTRHDPQDTGESQKATA